MAAVKKKTTKTTKPKTAPKTATKKKPKGEPPPTKKEVAAWRAMTHALDFDIEILTTDGIQTAPGNTKVKAGRWFAAVPRVPSSKPYHFLLQWNVNKRFVLAALVDGAGATRLPPTRGWERALVDGKLHILSSDILLTRRQIAAIIGGHEPPVSPAKPPDT